MSKKFKVLEDNDIQLLTSMMVRLRLSMSRMSRLMDCSNAIYNWGKGYRRIPRAFKRFMLVLVFIEQKGLMEELNQFIRKEERKR